MRVLCFLLAVLLAGTAGAEELVLESRGRDYSKEHDAGYDERAVERVSAEIKKIFAEKRTYKQCHLQIGKYFYCNNLYAKPETGDAVRVEAEGSCLTKCVHGGFATERCLLSEQRLRITDDRIELQLVGYELISKTDLLSFDIWGSGSKIVGYIKRQLRMTIDQTLDTVTNLRVHDTHHRRVLFGYPVVKNRNPLNGD